MKAFTLIALFVLAGAHAAHAEDVCKKARQQFHYTKDLLYNQSKVLEQTKRSDLSSYADPFFGEADIEREAVLKTLQEVRSELNHWDTKIANIESKRKHLPAHKRPNYQPKRLAHVFALALQGEEVENTDSPLSEWGSLTLDLKYAINESQRYCMRSIEALKVGQKKVKQIGILISIAKNPGLAVDLLKHVGKSPNRNPAVDGLAVLNYKDREAIADHLRYKEISFEGKVLDSYVKAPIVNENREEFDLEKGYEAVSNMRGADPKPRFGR